MRPKQFLHAAILIAALLPLAGTSVAQASFSMVLDTTFSGGTMAAGSYIQVDVVDVGVNAVELTITSNLASGEFLRQLYLNFDPFSDLPTFGSPTSTSGSFTNPSVSWGHDSFKADGDGEYDILFDFSNAPPAARFDGTDSITYSLSAANLSAAKFDAWSAPAGGHGPFRAAAHVQGLAGGDSAWVTEGVIPAPGAALLGVIGLGLVGWMKRRMA